MECSPRRAGFSCFPMTGGAPNVAWVSAMGRRTSASQDCGSTSLSLAVAITMYIATARAPRRSEPANSYARLPRQSGLNALSAAFLVRQMRPSSRNRLPLHLEFSRLQSPQENFQRSHRRTRSRRGKIMVCCIIGVPEWPLGVLRRLSRYPRSCGARAAGRHAEGSVPQAK